MLSSDIDADTSAVVGTEVSSAVDGAASVAVAGAEGTSAGGSGSKSKFDWLQCGQTYRYIMSKIKNLFQRDHNTDHIPNLGTCCGR